MAGLLKGFLGGQGQQNEPSGTDIIQKLKNRVTSSTLLEDRRDAVRAIKSLAKKYQAEVGAQCLTVLLNVIQSDRSDSEIIGYAVDALWSICEVEDTKDLSSEMGVRFSEDVLRDPNNLTLILGLLEEFDFNVRRPTACLLTALLRNKPAEVQDAVLVSPGAISRVMDLLVDSREVIRNDALLLLLHLTRSNRQIQKIVAFENAFDRLLAIIRDEGFSDGGIIAEDCLVILENLLRGNNSNQSFFREASLINHLVPWFDFKHVQSGSAWSAQKVNNVYHMLKLVRILVSPSNPQQSTAACQKAVKQSGLLDHLCVFMFSSGVPTELLTETIAAVAEVIRGFETNQQFFETVTTPSTPPRPAILALLMSMVTEKQPVPLRLAALYCFQCYVYKNESAQEKVINTLLPSSSEPSISSGQVLIAGLFGNDPLSNWCTAIALANSLSEKLKTQLLRVQLSMQGQNQVTLLQQITAFLSQRSDLKVQTRIGLLVLLCTWLADCSMAVKQFVNDKNNIPFLIGQLEHSYSTELGQMSRCLYATVLGIILAYHDGSSSEYSPDTIRQIISHRIGQEAFKDCLVLISGSELFTRAAKSPQVQASCMDEVCFDYAFTVFFKQSTELIVRALDSNLPPPKSTEPVANGSATNLSTSIEDHDSIVNQYKDLIRDQDEELTALRAKYKTLEETRSEDKATLQEQAVTIQTLREQVSMYADLKENVSGGDEGDEVKQLQSTIVSLQKLQDAQRQDVVSKDLTIQQLQRELESLRTSYSDQVNKLRMENTEQQEQTLNLKAENEALLTYRTSLDEQLKTLQEQVKGSQPGQVEGAQNSALQQKIQHLEVALKEVQDRNEALERETEDLLVLLADQDLREKKYKALLVEHGIEIPESESEGDSEEEEEEEDVD